MARLVNQKEFETEIAAAGALPAIVDFTATWCGPCQSLSPHIDALAKEYDGQINVVKVDIDQEPDLATRFGVMGVPYILFLKGGAKVDQISGNYPAKIREKAKALLG